MARTMCQTQVPSTFIHFLSDRSDQMETINRYDRWTIFFSDRSDHMETSLYMTDKNSEVCINTRSPAVSLSIMGRDTE